MSRPAWKGRRERRARCSECRLLYPTWRTFECDGKILCLPSCNENALYAARTMPHDPESKWTLAQNPLDKNDWSG